MNGEPVYVVMHRRPCVSARVCDARGCDEVVHPGEDLCTVIHGPRYVRDPGGDGTQALLCGSCTDRLLERGTARLADLRSTLGPPAPAMYRGKLVPSF